jgi:transposase InsO family protein
MAAGTLSFEKLNSNNYSHWSFKMEIFLKKEKCWQVVNTIKPAEAGPDWDEMDAKALHLIVLCVENNQLIHIKKAANSKVAWENLKKYHQKSTLGSKIRLMKKLFKAELQKDGDMESHIQQMIEWMDELVALGDELQEKLCVAIILASLNEDYDTLITALEVRTEDELKLEDVRTRLLEEYEKRKNKNIGIDSAMKAIKISKYIKNKNLDEGNKNFSKNKIKCSFCKDIGHYKAICEKFKIWRANKPKPQQSANVVQKEQQHFALNSASVNYCSDYDWCIDSGCTTNICNNKNLYTTFDPTINEDVQVANKQTIVSEGRGNIDINIEYNGQSSVFHLRDVLYLPQASCNLLSVRKLDEKGWTTNFGKNKCQLIFRADNQIYAEAVSKNGLYFLKCSNKVYNVLKPPSSQKFCIHEWHRRLAHKHLAGVRKMEAYGLKIKSCSCSDLCEPCLKGKMTRKSFPKQSENKSTHILDLIVSDVCGPMPVNSISGYRYFCTFVDEFSCYTHVEFLKEKSEVSDHLINFIESVKTKFHAKPKKFRSDRGGEYFNIKVRDYLKKQGIKLELTVGYSPEQNGIAERKNRTLVEAARTMLAESKLDESYWAEAILCANFVQNRIVTSVTDKTPIEVWTNKKSTFTDFHAFGTDVYSWIPSEKRKKFDEKSEKLKFVGYDENAKGYRLIDINNKKKIIISRNVNFLKDSHQSTPSTEFVKNKSVLINLEENQNETTFEEEQNHDLEAEIKNDSDFEEETNYNEDIFFDTEYIELENDKSNENFINDEVISENVDDPFNLSLSSNSSVIEQQQQQVYPQRENRGKLPKHFDSYEIYYANTEDLQEPKNVQEVMLRPDKELWIAAMKEELESIEQNKTWELVNLPINRKPIGCKWVFKLKRDVKGKISKYKARLVAQGFSQMYGTDYDEVFAPVVRQSTFRILLSVAGKRKLKVKHYDVRTAFLNGELEEEIYIRQPPGFVNGSKCYRLKKALYGLKQAARTWNKAIHKILREFGYIQSKHDKCLYMKGDGHNICYILIYVDDLVIASRNESEINKIAKYIGSNFGLNDLGEIRYFLGIEIEKDVDGNFLISQSNYIDKIVKMSGLADAKSSKTPLDPGYEKLKHEKYLKDSKIYQQIIGQLLYISTNTRPDISSSVSILSQKLSRPSETDYVEAKRIIKYLKGTRNFKLELSSSKKEQNLNGFSDANWAESRIDRKSNSGHLFMLNGGTVSWACRKQNCVALSSTEAEYIALSEASQEAVWLKGICSDFNINMSKAIVIQADNQSCIKMTDCEKFSNRSKHIDTKYHFIKDLKNNNVISLKYVSSENNVADLLTKPLGSTRIKFLRSKANILEADQCD